jgi:hypothetical protein
VAFLAAAALAVLVAGSLAGALALRLGLTGTLLATYLLACAQLVIAAEVLSPFHAVRAPGLLATEAAAAAAGIACWMRGGRWHPPLLRVTPQSLRRHPNVLMLAAAVTLALAFELFLALAAAPNNWDALTYHLSRAAAWYQRGSVGFFSAHTPRENIYPPNAEIQILYTMVFTRGDRLSALPQFLAEIVSMIAIFGIGRRIGFGRAGAAFAALLFATLSEVALEATTAQNDLVVGAFVAVGAYFVLGRSKREHALAGAAVGLALGTKLTALYALPLLALLALCTMRPRRLLLLAGATAVAFAALGSLVYVENVLHYGSPLGPASARSMYRPRVTPTNVISSSARTLDRFLDLSGYDPAPGVRYTLFRINKFVFETVHIDPNPAGASLSRFSYTPSTSANEDFSYFGPLGAGLLLPLSLAYLVAAALRRRSRAKLAFALSVPVFALELALTYKYNAWEGRFMIVPVLLATVLAAGVYVWRGVSAMCAAIGVLVLALALAHNERKPIGAYGSTPVWELGRAQAQGLVSLGAAQLFRRFDAIVPSRARTGVVFGDDDWDYPLYGAHLSRKLVVLDPATAFQQARAGALDWIVFGSVCVPSARGWKGAELGGWRLFARDGTAAAVRLAQFRLARPSACRAPRSPRTIRLAYPGNRTDRHVTQPSSF